MPCTSLLRARQKRLIEGAALDWEQVFSRRTGWVREQTALARATTARYAGGLPVIDLAQANPTRCGFLYDRERLLEPLGNPASLTYDPEPFGLPAARQAVCEYYQEHDASVAPSQVCLTTSTSEAYSFLFRLLCDPGDEVLIAQPSYPLFAFLADLDNVRLVTFPLLYDHGWQMQPGALEAHITPRTRAIVIVHPNNPTGHYTSAVDRAVLERVCVERELALIVDEVFLDYSFQEPPSSFAQGDSASLTFVLSGLSKVAALPQMKAAWIVTLGPEEQRSEALARLELIADTFLSMTAPVQHALPAWLAERGALQQQIAARTRSNLSVLDALLLEEPMASRLVVEAGWYAVLRVPSLGPDDELALLLVERWGVLVHPGHYYGMVDAGWLVVSLLPPTDDFAQGIRHILAACRERVSALAQSAGA